MITLREIMMKGMRGQEIRFSTGEDVAEDIFLSLPPDMMFWSPPLKLSAQTGPGLGFSLITGYAISLCAVNDTLKGIYENFRFINSPDAAQKYVEEFLKDSPDPAFFTMQIQSMTDSKYQLGVQNLFYLLRKVCYAAILIKADKIVPEGGEMPPSISSLFDEHYLNSYKEKIIEAAFKRPESSEVFRIIEDVNNIFQSFHMFTVLKMMDGESPVVRAFGPPDRSGYAFLFHAHMLRQIIKAVNTALQDIDLL
ncbi:MAG: hypothetical protein LBQ51_05570 [Desulfovibrio sp.]|jgi:hypothetical protein|nr:hypothetical protein [Desulfovibrio sp.]